MYTYRPAREAIIAHMVTPLALPIYLDHNATTVPLAEVVRSVSDALLIAYGNPSSGHRKGEPARRVLQQARSVLQKHLGGSEECFIFVGSGTEANNLALRSLTHRHDCLITSAIEHSSVLATAARTREESKALFVVPANADGRIQLSALERYLVTHRGAAVSIQWVNNETGVVQPISEIIALAHQYGALVHVDAAQAIGKIDESLERFAPDFMSLTAHKFNGPAGVGVLFARDPSLITPICVGGKQQGGLHAGTENVAGVAGLARALELRYENLQPAIEHMRALRDHFELSVLERCPWVHVNGGSSQRVCNTSNLRFEGIDGQALVGRLDAVGIYCSQSSACTSGRPEPSYVLRAMGLTEEQAYASVRFSFGVTSTFDEATLAASTVAAEAEYLKRIFG